MSEVLYVLGLNNNLLSIFTMEEREYAMTFVDGHVLDWPKGLNLDLLEVIGTRDGSLSKLIG
jgi:hypothetical protein